MGLTVGWVVGLPVGTAVGLAVGLAVGFDVGLMVGLVVGDCVGLSDGEVVGFEVGGMSMMVTVPVPSAMSRPTGLLSSQLKNSVLSDGLLNVVRRVIVAVVSPGAKVTIPVSAG